MTCDVNKKEYYFNFISKAKTDKTNYSNKIEELTNDINTVKPLIIEKIKDIESLLNSSITARGEIVHELVDDEDSLYQLTMRRLRDEENPTNRQLLIMLARYCRLIKSRSNYRKMLKLCDDRANVTYSQYRDIVDKYYNQVNIALLQGFGYRYGHGLGVVSINRYKLRDDVHKVVDFAATRKAKKELLDKGLKPYDKHDAELYAKQGIPYDGVEYVKYKKGSYYYEITLSDCKIYASKSIQFYKDKKLLDKFKGMSYEELAAICNTDEEIYNLQVDTTVKLNIILIKHPEYFYKFIRNVEESKYKYRKNNR